MGSMGEARCGLGEKLPLNKVVRGSIIHGFLSVFQCFPCVFHGGFVMM